MVRYSKRSATSGDITLNSSRKDGNTLTFWYWARAGKKWVEFDIRELASRAGSEIPKLITIDELSACQSGGCCYESLLQRDLQRVADWCAEIGALTYVADGKCYKQVVIQPAPQSVRAIDESMPF